MRVFVVVVIVVKGCWDAVTACSASGSCCRAAIIPSHVGGMSVDGLSRGGESNTSARRKTRLAWIVHTLHDRTDESKLDRNTTKG